MLVSMKIILIILIKNSTHTAKVTNYEVTNQGHTKLVVVNEVERLKWKTKRDPSNVIEGLHLLIITTIGQTTVCT